MDVATKFAKSEGKCDLESFANFELDLQNLSQKSEREEGNWTQNKLSK